MCTLTLLLIGHLNSLQKRLYEQATRDQLTGLHNRRWFMDQTAATLGAGQALMIVDVDRFKAVNDTYGHETGDLCLMQMATHLRSAVRDTDLCARIGGEEFAMLARDADPECLRRIATKISDGFTFVTVNSMQLRITASVGIAIDAHCRIDAFRLADEAVYRAKNNGRACYVIADKATNGLDPVAQQTLCAS